MRHKFSAAPEIAARIAGTGAASAQAVCAVYANGVQNLNEDQKETEQAMSLATNGCLLELFTDASGQWTLLAVARRVW